MNPAVKRRSRYAGPRGELIQRHAFAEVLIRCAHKLHAAERVGQSIGELVRISVEHSIDFLNGRDAERARQIADLAGVGELQFTDSRTRRFHCADVLALAVVAGGWG